MARLEAFGTRVESRLDLLVGLSGSLLGDRYSQGLGPKEDNNNPGSPSGNADTQPIHASGGVGMGTLSVASITSDGRSSQRWDSSI